MNRTKISETASIKAIEAFKCGKRVQDICLDLKIHRSTFYSWKKRYIEMQKEEKRRLDRLEEENRYLQQQCLMLETNNRLILNLLRG